MGNHSVGSMFAAGAGAIEPYIDSFTQKEAEEALERIWNVVKESYEFSPDAEFDDHTNPDQPLGRLLIKVFAFEHYEKWRAVDWKNASDDLWEESGQTYWQFKEKYDLC